ncbi:MAG: hypothetical protein SOW01_05275 [Mediterranea sp.]|nr:hypothetical protein [Mediterranea sp.]
MMISLNNKTNTIMNFNYFDRVALSTFTSLEKQSLYQLLCGAMMIDGNRDSREIAIINEVNQVIGITAADVEASRKLSETTMNGCLRNMDTMKKAYVGKFMAQVILADGVITQREEQFFYFMKQRLGLPDID